MAATPPKKSIVNPTLVRLDAEGAAGVSRTRSGKGLVKTDSFRVSSNLDAGVPRRARLPRGAAGDDIVSTRPADAVEVTTVNKLQEPSSAKRRQEGPSARKRKAARAADEAPPPHASDNKNIINEEMDAGVAAPNEDKDNELSDAMPEVSNDEGLGGEDDNSGTESAPRSSQKPNTLPIAKGTSLTPADEDDKLTNDNDDDLDALGGLMRDPQLVCSVFARRAVDKRMAGLDLAERVWATTRQLLGDYSAAQKLAWAAAASKERAYLVVMGGSKNFTLIHHLTVLNVELRPKDPILRQVVVFEAEMRDDSALPRLVLFDGRPQISSV
jgi:hypothetical protein